MWSTGRAKKSTMCKACSLCNLFLLIRQKTNLTGSSVSTFWQTLTQSKFYSERINRKSLHKPHSLHKVILPNFVVRKGLPIRKLRMDRDLPDFIHPFPKYPVIIEVPNLGDVAGALVDAFGLSLPLYHHTLSDTNWIIVKVWCALRTAHPSTLRL
jgi:hypothetical protein